MTAMGVPDPAEAQSALRDAARALLNVRLLVARGMHRPADEARAWDRFALALDAAEDAALHNRTRDRELGERIAAAIEAAKEAAFYQGADDYDQSVIDEFSRLLEAAIARAESERARQHTETECHCGEPVVYGYDGDPTHHRGMCGHCDLVRCDAYPGECNRPSRASDSGAVGE